MKSRVKRYSLLPLAVFCTTSLMAHPYNADLSVQELRSNLDQAYESGQINYKQYLLNHAYAKDNNKQIDITYLSHNDKVHANNNDIGSYALTFDMFLLEKNIQVLTLEGYINSPSNIDQVNIPEATSLLDRKIGRFENLEQIQFTKDKRYITVGSECLSEKCYNLHQETLYDFSTIEYIPGVKISYPPYTLHGGYHIKIKLLPFSFLLKNSQEIDIQIEEAPEEIQKAMSLFISLGTNESPFIFFSQNMNDCQVDYAKALSLGMMNEDEYYQSLISHQAPIIENNNLLDYRICQGQPYIQHDQYTYIIYAGVFSLYTFERAITYLHSDMHEFARWIKKSAKVNQMQAQYNLGMLYYLGDGGIEQNFVESEKWHLKAAHQGHIKSMLILAELYRDGNDVIPKDAVKSSFWFEKKAEALKKENK
mgnify:CR=1 FL=1